MRILRAFGILLIFVLLSVIHLSISTGSIKTSYEISELKQQLDAIKPENRYLNYLAAKAEALPRIEKLATNKLKMEYPQKMNYVIVSKESEAR